MTERFLAYAIGTAGMVAVTAPALVSARRNRLAAAATEGTPRARDRASPK